MLEREGSGAAPVFMVAYNHFAVEFLLLLLERIFHLLPLQTSIPVKRVICSVELQACTDTSAGASQSSRSHTSRTAAFVPQAARTLRADCPQGEFLSHLALPGVAPMALHSAQHGSSV